MKCQFLMLYLQIGQSTTIAHKTRSTTFDWNNMILTILVCAKLQVVPGPSLRLFTVTDIKHTSFFSHPIIHTGHTLSSASKIMILFPRTTWKHKNVSLATLIKKISIANTLHCHYNLDVGIQCSRLNFKWYRLIHCG